MKTFLFLSLLLASISVSAQADKNPVVGPSFFKLGMGSDKKMQTIPGPIKAKSDGVQAQLHKMLAQVKSINIPAVACTCESVVKNNAIVVSKIRACFQLSDGKLLLNGIDLSPTDVIAEQSRVQKILMGQVDPGVNSSSDPKQSSSDRSVGLPGEAEDGEPVKKSPGHKAGQGN